MSCLIRGRRPSMRVSNKYNDFINTIAKVEFLEGQTAAGKTTVGIFKFILDVADSDQDQHILAALDLGTAEKNIINKPHGIIDEFGPLVEYRGGGSAGEKMPHILLHTSKGDKKIYVLGYADKARWKKALGNQYGILYIDEINIADMDFVREAAMRCDKLIATLNPDDPSLPIYSEYINHSRPLPQYEADEPDAIMQELEKEQPKPGWVHWFFRMQDNISLSDDKIETIIGNVPPGTKLYKNKIEGIRCRATGLVFSNFDTKKNVIKSTTLAGTKFKRLSIGVDTAYSQKSPDTITMSLNGITKDGKLITLEERVYNNAERKTPLAPSDVVKEIVAFADFCRTAWGDFRTIYIDSADQATITECLKYKRENGCIYQFIPAYKETKILDRVNLQLGWIAKEQYLVCDHCKEHLREIGVYSWQEDKNVPEDGHDHTVNACQYAWLPYIAEIGAANIRSTDEYYG